MDAQVTELLFESCTQKTDYSQRTSAHSLQHKLLMLYEFQDYLLKGMNLYALYMLY